jgi:hypothetical protein
MVSTLIWLPYGIYCGSVRGMSSHVAGREKRTPIDVGTMYEVG